MPKQKSLKSKQKLPLLSRLWRNSQTKALAYFQGSGAVFLSVLSASASFFNDPHFKDFLSNFEAPKWVIISLASLALLTWLADGRDDA